MIVYNPMSNGSNSAFNGLGGCFQTEQQSQPYCINKLVEMILSSALLLSVIVITIKFLVKYGIRSHFWITGLLVLMVANLLANIFFIFFYNTFWLFPLETYFYKVYYLCLVCYICQAYLRKRRTMFLSTVEPAAQGCMTKKTGRNIYNAVLILLILAYTAILVVSIVLNNNSQGDDINCEHIWYLVFDTFCVLLSIIVFIILYKNYKEEMVKLRDYQNSSRRRPTEHQNRYSLRSSAEQIKEEVHNPLTKLWIWSLLNVAAQVIDVVESGFYLDATPPQCQIFSTNQTTSSILSILFKLLTLYLSYITTLWYISTFKLHNKRTEIDRRVHFSEEVKLTGHIELLPSSKQQTITAHI